MKVEAAPQSESMHSLLFTYDQAQQALREAQRLVRDSEFDLKQHCMNKGMGHMLKLDPVAIKMAIREAKGVR